MVKFGYKPTEVGDLPEGWGLVKIGDAYEFKNGLNKEKSAFGHGTPIVNYMDVFEHPGLSATDIQGLVSVTKEEKSAYSARRGDVFFTRTSETVDEIGLSSVLEEDVPDAVFSGFVLRGRSKGDQNPLTTSFQRYCFRSEIVRSQIRSSASYTTRALTNGKLLSKVNVPFPQEQSEQKAIAEALSDVDKLIAGLEALIAKQRALKTATMQQLLTGKTRLPGFEDEWTDISLFDLCDRQKPLFDDGDWVEAEHIRDRGIRLVQTGNIGVGSFLDRENKKYISQNSFNTLGCKDVFPGDLLICRLADPAGRACVLPDIGEARIITSVDVTIARPQEECADRRFLAQVMCSQEWFSQVAESTGGTTHKRISRGNLGEIRIRVPHIEEQKAIADILTDMDCQIHCLEESAKKTKALKQGMMQELLTGRTRLV